MKSDEIIKRVQSVAQIPSKGEAEKAIQATLETLSERILGDEASNLAAQLPEEFGQCLRGREGQTGEVFSLEEFYRRVSEKEHIEPTTAVNHVRGVMAVLNEAVTSGEFADVQGNLPEEYSELFMPKLGAGA
ncbi:MAG: DUF2267 domain-containing protein [Halothece sp.]